MRSVSRRLHALQAFVTQQQPTVMVVTLKDGTRVIADAASVWEHFKDPVKRKQVEAIRANRDDYAELAGVVEALCRS